MHNTPYTAAKTGRRTIYTAYRLRPPWIAQIPLALFAAAEIALWFLNLQTPNEAPEVLIALNLVFTVVPWLAIAALFLRTFFATTALGVLLFSCGAALWSASGLASFIFYLVPDSQAANTIVTFHNLIVWVASLCFLAGAALLHRGWPAIRRPWLALSAALGLTLAAAVLIAWCTLKGWTPVFFIQGEGATLDRQFVLGSTIIAILLTVSLLRKGITLRSPFLDWLALALIALAIGYGGLMLQTTVGGVLGWVSRGAQFLGGVYMLVAAHAAFADPNPPFVVLPQSEERAPHRYSLALAIVLVAAVLRLVLLQEVGVRVEFITFYPAVILAALYGGLRAGALATFLATLFASYFWIAPVGSLLIAAPMDWLTTGIFISSCLLISWIIELKQNAQARLREVEAERREELKRIVAKRTAELHKSEARLQAVLDSSPDPIFLKDRENRLLLANPATFAVIGKPAEACIGKTDDEFYDNPADGRAIMANDRRIMASGQAETVEETLHTPHGPRHYLSNKAAYRDAAGNIIGLIGTSRDITEHKRAEEALRESAATLLHAQRCANAGVWDVDLVNNRVTWSEPFYELVGLPRSVEPSYENWIASVHADDRQRVHDVTTKAIAGRTAARIEFRILRDGQVRWLHSEGRVICDSANRPARVTGITWDITERKRAEEALHRSEMRYRTLVEATTAVTWSCPPSGLHVEPQPAWMAFTGQTAEDMLGDGWSKVIHPDDLPKTAGQWLSAVALGKPFAAENRVRRYDGCWRWMSSHAAPIRNAEGEIVEWFGMNIDITEQKTAEEKLRESEERFRALTTASAYVVYRMNPDWSEMRALDGQDFLSSTTTPTQSWLDQYILPEDQPHVQEAIAQSIRTKSIFDLEHRVRRADGGIGWTHSRAVPLMDANGDVREWFGAATDITLQKQAEEAVRESEERYRGIFEDAGTGIAITDLNGRFQSCNPAFTAMLGYTEQELLGRDFEEIVHPDDREKNAAAAVRLRAQEIPSLELLTQYERKDRSSVWVHKRVSLLRDATGKPTHHIALVTDMTERKRYEEHIRLLMGEVNHRAKNMLAVVQSIARQTAATNAQDFAERFSQRVRSLAASQDLLVKSAWNGVNLEDLIRSQLAHLGDSIGERIALRGPALSITASAAQTIGMALHELSTNAGKYGSLSNALGRVEIAWSLKMPEDHLERFAMEWREIGGPPVTEPGHEGFGTIVVSQMVTMSLDADVDLQFAPDGVVWTLECLSDSILERRR